MSFDYFQNNELNDYLRSLDKKDKENEDMRNCDHCNNEVHKDELFAYKGLRLCPDCFEETVINIIK